MNNLFFGKYFKWFFWVFIIALVLSYVSYNFNSVNQIIFILISLATLILTVKNLKYGFYIILAELLIGSKGYLFWLDLNGTVVSIRLILFLIVMGVWLYHFIKKRKNDFFKTTVFKPFLLLIIFIIYGLLIGLIRKNSFDNIFFDINGYLYFGLVFLFFSVIRESEDIKKILQIFSAAIIAMGLQNLLYVYVFGHQFIFTMPSLYKWVRDFGLGEITRVTENFYRVFLQGQINALYLLFIILPFIFLPKQLLYFKKYSRQLYLIFGFSAFIILISFSRSFWLGLLGGFLVFYILLFLYFKLPLSQILKRSLVILIIIIISTGFLLGVANFPYPKINATTTASLIKSRALEDLTTEAGAASRWQLLPILKEKILDSSIIGHGFGATITYKTEDPRYLELHPDGLYTTFAFEWTYLDIWIKMGLLGLLAYIYFIYHIFKMGKAALKNQTEQFKPLIFGLLTALAALVILNLTTPYLNHPLGIGFIILSLAIFNLFNKHSDLSASSHVL